MHNCIDELLEALNGLAQQARERRDTEYGVNGTSKLFWQHVAKLDGIEAAIALAKCHTDCNTQEVDNANDIKSA